MTNQLVLVPHNEDQQLLLCSLSSRVDVWHQETLQVQVQVSDLISDIYS